MALSNVAIANRALQILGAKRISALDQDAPNARSMNTAFVPVRDALLRKYDWSFAIKRASVAANSTQDTYEGLNRYLLPNDYARLCRKQFTSGGTGTVIYYNPKETFKDWQIEGGYILTRDGSPLQFRYIAKVTDPATFDASFDELLAVKLAYEVIYDVNGSRVKKADLRRDVQDALADARRTNAFENPAREAPEDEWEIIMR